MKKIILTALCILTAVLSIGCGATKEHLEKETGYVDKANDIVENINNNINSYPEITE